jgi:hypothetical protein
MQQSRLPTQGIMVKPAVLRAKIRKISRKRFFVAKQLVSILTSAMK